MKWYFCVLYSTYLSQVESGRKRLLSGRRRRKNKLKSLSLDHRSETCSLASPEETSSYLIEEEEMEEMPLTAEQTKVLKASWKVQLSTYFFYLHMQMGIFPLSLMTR